MPEILAFLRENTGAVTAPETAAAVAPAGGADLAARFEAAVQKVSSAPSDGAIKPSNEMKLKMYALFRQAKDGDAQGKRPGMMDVVGRFKFDAWAELKGMAREEAMRRYADEVDSLERKFAGTTQKQA